MFDLPTGIQLQASLFMYFFIFYDDIELIISCCSKDFMVL